MGCGLNGSKPKLCLAGSKDIYNDCMFDWICPYCTNHRYLAMKRVSLRSNAADLQILLLSHGIGHCCIVDFSQWRCYVRTKECTATQWKLCNSHPTSDGVLCDSIPWSKISGVKVVSWLAIWGSYRQTLNLRWRTFCLVFFILGCSEQSNI